MSTLEILEQNLSNTKRMPVLFMAHGNPINAVEDNVITQKWNEIGKELSDAKAIVFISAHWLTKGTFISSAVEQNLIYDFYGFPDDLYNVKIKAQGNPKLAQEIKDYLINEVYLDQNRGLDHGSWTLLKHISPNNKIPVFQISLDMNKSLSETMEYFERLRGHRKKGVVFIGSGNLIHNLRLINPYSQNIEDWAKEFDFKIETAISHKQIDILNNPYKIGRSANLAIPTDDHYRPMIAAFGLLYPDEEIDYFNQEVFEMGSIGMRSFITV